MDVVFVCTGNTCRSPLAESIAKSLTEAHTFSSRGISAFDGMPISAYSAELIAKYDLPKVGPSKQFTEEDADADLILTMSEHHSDYIKMMFPEAHVQTLKNYAAGMSGDIADPYGGNLEDYERAYQQISELVHKAFSKF